MKIVSFVIVIIMFSASCQDEQSEVVLNEGTLIFGEAFGFCAGDCAHFYKLDDQKLYQDKIETYAGSVPHFDDAILPKAKLDIAAPLANSFPQYLLDNPNKTFGCPDCADQGGVHLYYVREGEGFYWHIDTAVDNQPAEIRNYIMQVRTIIDQLED